MRRTPRQIDRESGPSRLAGTSAVLVLATLCPGIATAADRAESSFQEQVRPILEDRCFACHGNGIKKGGVDLDGAAPGDRDLWWGVLKNVRAGIMPPADKPQPSSEERRRLEDWIKTVALGIDPEDPDPGRVTVRRLNRVEYRNTVRDLIGVDYDTTSEFPPDDTGNGFDNIGDVLTLSPLLLEKYLAAAKTIVGEVVPTVSRVVADRVIPGREFLPAGGGKDGPAPPSLSYYEPATVSTTVPVEHDGQYRLILNLSANERFVDGVNDYNRCRLLFRADGEELVRQEFVRQDGRLSRFEFARDWKAGPHELTIEVQPLTPDQKQVRSLSIRIQSVILRGPMDERYWVRPPQYAQFFPGEVPEDIVGRRLYARELLGRFAARAFRRPVDNADQGPARSAGRGGLVPAGTDFRVRCGPGDGGRPDLAPVPLPRGAGRAERARPASAGRRIRPGLAAVLFPVVVDARRRRSSGSPRSTRSAQTSRPRSAGCSAIPDRRSSSATSSDSGSRRATSRRYSSTPGP